jgi:hypothetical protein
LQVRQLSGRPGTYFQYWPGKLALFRKYIKFS